MNAFGRHYGLSAMVLCGLVILGGAVAVGFFGFGVAPWFVLMGAFCVLMMGSMLWMMVGMGNHAGHRIGSHTRQSSVASRQPVLSKESAVEILERRFAEGAITAEDYRARRELLVDRSAGSNGVPKDERLTAQQGAEGRR
jgi:uncharacterized membrane protein